MSDIIEKYYEENGVSSVLKTKRVAKFAENADIEREFERWIESKEYTVENPITIEGYTAKNLSEESQFLDGEGAFLMLIELRENPQKALKRIKNGFVIK